MSQKIPQAPMPNLPLDGIAQASQAAKSKPADVLPDDLLASAPAKPESDTAGSEPDFAEKAAARELREKLGIGSEKEGNSFADALNGDPNGPHSQRSEDTFYSSGEAKAAQDEKAKIAQSKQISNTIVMVLDVFVPKICSARMKVSEKKFKLDKEEVATLRAAFQPVIYKYMDYTSIEMILLGTILGIYGVKLYSVVQEDSYGEQPKKKPATKPKKEEDTNEAAAEYRRQNPELFNMETDEQEPITEPVKRGRGRPRKNP